MKLQDFGFGFHEAIIGFVLAWSRGEYFHRAAVSTLRHMIMPVGLIQNEMLY